MATKASQRVQRYVNANGPTIGTVERRVIEQDGLYFKDIDGTGTVSAVNDWRRFACRSPSAWPVPSFFGTSTSARAPQAAA